MKIGILIGLNKRSGDGKKMHQKKERESLRKTWEKERERRGEESVRKGV